MRYRFVRLGYDPETLPFSFDRAMVVLAEKLYDEFVSEARKDNSPVQPLVNEELLSTVRIHHAVLRELVIRVPQLGLTPEEALLQSKARCAVRWEALGIRREEAVALAADLEIGAPPSSFWTELELGDRSGHVSILTAELGAGKSLMLDRIHQRALTRFDGTSRSPVPVVLRARDVTGSLREALLTKAGPMGGDASLRGCLV